MSIKIKGFNIPVSVEGALVYKGTWDASTGTPDLSNATKGDLYIIETGGTIYGKTWEVTDLLIVNENMGGTVTNSKLDRVDGSEAGVTPASETVAGIIEIATNAEATAGSANNRALVPSNLSSIGTSQLSNDANFTAVGSVISNFVNDAGYIIAESDTLSSVVARGATTSSSITTGGLTTSGDIDPDTNNSYSIGDEDFRFISYYGDMNGAIRFKAKNDQGGLLTKGEAVYIKGINGSVPTVAKAQANSASTMPAFGLVYANANDQAEVQIITFGNLNDMNTGTLGAGDTVYISSSSAGALVNTPPTGESNFIQNIGRVVRADSSAGIIKVGGAGRSNATPNLDQDKIFLGNASNQAVSTALSSVGLSKFSNDAGFISSVSSASETVQGIIEIATNAEATTGTATDKALVPSNLSSIGTSQLNNDAGFIDNTSASETVAGILETATNAEATTGTANNKILVPSNLSSVGTSQLNNDAGFLANINSESLNDLSDVSYTAGAGIDNYVLTYDHSTTSWGAEASAGAPPASETTAGILEIATNAEATTGTATDKALVPSNISSIGTSQLNNDAGFLANINNESLNDLNDVSYTAGAGIDNYVLTYDHSTTSWGAESVPSGTPASETVAGIIEIATNAEATAGTATDKALVPSNLSSVGTSQLNNDAGFLANINSESLNDLSDVSYTAGAGIDNYVLTYDHSTTSWGAEAVPSATPASETTAGVIEIATNAEATAGTATDKALVPSNLSSIGTSQLNNDAGFIDNTSASETVAGILETATNAEATAGTANNKILVPSNLSSIGTSQLNNDAGFISSVSSASETVQGIIEIATNAEATTGTATDKALVPSNLSSIGTSQLNNDAGFLANISSESLNDLSDVSYTAGAGIDNYVLTYDHSTTSWGAEASAGGGSTPSVTTDSSGTNTTISTNTGIEEVHLINNGASAVTITIPTASTVGSGYKYNIKRLGTANVTLQSQSISAGNNQIDGQNSYILTSVNESLTVISNGTTFFII